ncbi:MAG: hypothetical protein IH941_00855 [Acidobacteria bacterium]|nr:hypothetical protein [Acidobacteriota bacterium]
MSIPDLIRDTAHRDRAGGGFLTGLLSCFVLLGRVIAIAAVGAPRQGLLIVDFSDFRTLLSNAFD